MKSVFLLAGVTAILLSCNNNSNTENNSGTSNHAAHQKANNNSMNEMHQVMNTMMHEMHEAKPTGNNDIDFAAMMLEHHKGAVEMSKVEIAKGSDTEMKAFAQKVIDDQNKENAFMQEFISKAPKTASSNSADFQKALNNSMMAMMNDNTTIYNDIDKDFAAQMIPHHQSAVDMAEAYLQYGKETSLRTLCQNIIHSQTKEINWLKKWLAKSVK